MTQGVTPEEQRQRITDKLNELRGAEDISGEDEKARDAATGKMLLSVIVERNKNQFKAVKAAKDEMSDWVNSILNMPGSRIFRKLNRLDKSGRYAEGFRQRAGNPDLQKEWLEKIYKGEV